MRSNISLCLPWVNRMVPAAVAMMSSNRIRNRRPCMERKTESMSVSPSYGSRQQIAFIAQRLDQSGRARVVTQLLAQAADVKIDGAVERVCLAALRQRQQLVAAER